MIKILISTIIVFFLALVICFIYIGYQNYQVYASYFEEADKYGITYDQTDNFAFESEITDIKQQIAKAQEEEKVRIEQEKQAAIEAQKKAEEQARKEEEARLAQEAAEEQARIEEEQRLAQEETEKQQAETNTTGECEPYYVNGILLVNKNHCLPSTYAPGGLTPETYEAVNAMIYDASLEDINLTIVSGYRSYEKQVDTFNYWVNTLGYDEAIKVSAEPGYSEHQTGLALDIGASNGVCELETCFYDTPEGQWVAEHAHEYGFIVRYPDGQEAITGYTYKPWHLRYVGVDVATDIYNAGITLEEYLGVY